MFGMTDKKSASSTQVANAAKTLLANIRFMNVDDPIRSMVITSSVPNEGKSYVSYELAKAIATSGKTCLLVEADLRRRSMAQAIGVRARYGMYSVLVGSVTLEQAVCTTSTKNLHFLDVEKGIPNPSDLFASRRFVELLHEIEAGYDYVIFDTPPVSAFVDSAVLSTEVDATLLVVREGSTKRDVVLDSLNQLKQAGGRIEGVILNDCKPHRGEYYYDYYDKSAADSGVAPVFQEKKRHSVLNSDDRLEKRGVSAGEGHGPRERRASQPAEGSHRAVTEPAGAYSHLSRKNMQEALRSRQDSSDDIFGDIADQMRKRSSRQ